VFQDDEMFEKILLPTDGSRHSAEAARIAADIASTHSGVVHPLVAVEYQFVTGGDLSQEMSDAIRARIDRRARQALDEAERIIREAGAQAKGKIVEGETVSAILAEAEQGEHTLIVMGSRGISEEQGHERHIGSVTERVLHRTPCPVLVIRAEGKP
jgi:nucleotide-binding universal stress UspA family protein